MASVYVSDQTFQNFVRQVVALPFLPLTQLDSAVDDLREFEFKQSSSTYEKCCGFRDQLLDYFVNTWISGTVATNSILIVYH